MKSNHRRKALHSLSERRRHCRKRTHLRTVHRAKQFSLSQTENNTQEAELC